MERTGNKAAERPRKDQFDLPLEVERMPAKSRFSWNPTVSAVPTLSHEGQRGPEGHAPKLRRSKLISVLRSWTNSGKCSKGAYMGPQADTVNSVECFLRRARALLFTCRSFWSPTKVIPRIVKGTT